MKLKIITVLSLFVIFAVAFGVQSVKAQVANNDSAVSPITFFHIKGNIKYRFNHPHHHEHKDSFVPAAGVTVTATDTATHATYHIVTDARGNYILPVGGSGQYLVHPSDRRGHKFTPASRLVNVQHSVQGGVNFQGQIK